MLYHVMYNCIYIILKSTYLFHIRLYIYNYVIEYTYTWACILFNMLIYRYSTYYT